MNKLIHLALLGVIGLVVVAANSRVLIALAAALIPLVAVVGVVVGVLRVVWAATRRW